MIIFGGMALFALVMTIIDVIGSHQNRSARR